MKYNPLIHHRRSIRLKGYDYSQAGAYFITICCHGMQCRFGNVGAPIAGAQERNAQVHLNDFGMIAYNEWSKLPERFPYMELDVFQIMPNHIHGIVVLNDETVGAPLAGALKEAPTAVGDIVGAYKSLVMTECLRFLKQQTQETSLGKLWQRNYHEHIIRNEKSYNKIASYIINNPDNWINDKFYTPD
jgi:putative transposase